MIQVDIEDGWGSGGLRVACAGEHALVLRRTHASRAAQDERYLRSEDSSNAHRLMVSSMAEPCVRRTMGRKPERISVVCALELHGAQLREALDVVAQGDQGVDAFEKLGQAHRPRGEVERAGGRVEAEAGDLAGAHGYGEMDGRLVVADDAFDVNALVAMALECGEACLAEDQLDHHGHAAARDLGGQARRVVREEVAQDDPEPVHVLDYKSADGPADSKGLHPTSLRAWCLILLEAFGSFPTDWERLFPRISSR